MTSGTMHAMAARYLVKNIGPSLNCCKLSRIQSVIVGQSSIESLESLDQSSASQVNQDTHSTERKSWLVYMKFREIYSCDLAGDARQEWCRTAFSVSAGRCLRLRHSLHPTKSNFGTLDRVNIARSLMIKIARWPHGLQWSKSSVEKGVKILNSPLLGRNCTRLPRRPMVESGATEPFYLTHPTCSIGV
jgi:hypothetical protein